MDAATRETRGTCLLLSILNGQFQPIQTHPISVLEGWSFGIVIEHYFQFVRTSRVIQQSRGEILTLLPQFLMKLKQWQEKEKEIVLKKINESVFFFSPSAGGWT